MVVAVLAVLALLGGYAAADAADAVPGVLTTTEPPQPPPLPEAPGAEAAGLDASEPVLASLDDGAPLPDPAALAATVGPLLADPGLGGSVGATVLDGRTGDVLLDDDGTTPREPASVAKLLTAGAVLHRLGPDATLPTRTVLAEPGRVVLVGGGDVLLAPGEGRPTAAGRAGLADLADATAQALAQGGGSGPVQLVVDDSLTGGAPSLGPGWSPTDVSAGFAAPVTSLAVLGGRLSEERYAPRAGDPSLAAAETLAQLLGERGVDVAGEPTRASAPAPDGARVLGEVRSAPLDEVVAHTLAESDNTAAEALAFAVAADAGRPATFASAAAAVLAEVEDAGVDTTGAVLTDGSGLGEGSELPPAVLAGLLARAAAPDADRLRPLLTGLPVAGLTGTLDDRFTGPSGSGAATGAGLVRAKTGSLSGTTSLVGQVVDADGRLLVFAVLADDAAGTRQAREAVDAVAAALAGCGCR